MKIENVSSLLKGMSRKILFTKEKTRCKTSKYRFYSGFIIMTETSNPLPVLPAV